MQQTVSRRRDGGTTEEVAPHRPSKRVDQAREVHARAADLLDEIDTVLDDEAQRAIARQAYKEKLASLALGPRHCCGACSDCPFGYRS